MLLVEIHIYETQNGAMAGQPMNRQVKAKTVFHHPGQVRDEKKRV
jgi:hypothetical protein